VPTRKPAPRRKSKPTQPETFERAAESTAFVLHALGYDHLRARIVGKSVVIESGPEDDPMPHARLMRLSDEDWRIDFPKSSGRWETTPYTGPRGNLVAEIHQNAPWMLAPRWTG
jgi:hypothetical protein